MQFLNLPCEAEVHSDCKVGSALLPIVMVERPHGYDLLQGLTPLHLVVRDSWSDCVIPSRLKNLLEHKADVDSVDNRVSWSKVSVCCCKPAMQ